MRAINGGRTEYIPFKGGNKNVVENTVWKGHLGRAGAGCGGAVAGYIDGQFAGGEAYIPGGRYGAVDGWQLLSGGRGGRMHSRKGRERVAGFFGSHLVVCCHVACGVIDI